MLILFNKNLGSGFVPIMRLLPMRVCSSTFLPVSTQGVNRFQQRGDSKPAMHLPNVLSGHLWIDAGGGNVERAAAFAAENVLRMKRFFEL